MIKRLIRVLIPLLALSFVTLGAQPLSSGRDFRNAVRLYEKGMYSAAEELFAAMRPSDEMSLGYALLCDIRTRADGYEAELAEYERVYGETALSPGINLQYASNLFDDARYDEALYRYSLVPRQSLSYRQYTESVFKQAYARSAVGDYAGAEPLYDEVIARRKSAFTAPSWYGKGYVHYTAGDFAGAYDAFEQSARDARFASPASYYMLECRFMQKDYGYVTSHAEEVYAQATEERRPHLARIISEAYLVKGDAAAAERYYSSAVSSSADMTRADYFYAGSLQYALGHYREAIPNFAEMKEYSDSVGQIAAYQMGYSYIQTKDKVSAMDAFRKAAQTSFDAGIREDAHLNYAKLAFDLNQDSAPFADYLKAYPGTDKHDQIYDYMAVASLYKRDYVSAIDAYDHIDNLTPVMKSNYMKANYLRAEQLISGASWRDAVPALKAVGAYTPKSSQMGRLSRYWLAESYYNTEDYKSAGEIYTELYNASAMDRQSEGKLLPYNIAYCYFQSSDYAAAAGWFDRYLAAGDGFARHDALVRKGDCYFYRQQYQDAATAYSRAVDEYPDIDNIYQYYNLGLAYGFAGAPESKVRTLAKVLPADASRPHYAEAVYELGRSYVSLGQEENAVRAFNAIISRSADSSYVARSLIELAMIDRNAGRYAQALENYKQVARRYKGTEAAEGALLAIESIYQSQGEPEKYFAFVEDLGRPAVSDEEKERVVFTSAEQIFFTENYPRAISTFEKYMEMYPSGAYLPQAACYTAESYRALGQKERACDWFARVRGMQDAGDCLERAARGYADLSFELERYADAYDGYSGLLESASSPDALLQAHRGMMLSAYRLHRYDDAVFAADKTLQQTPLSADFRRGALYIKAKSLLSTSRRDEAYDLWRILSAEPATAEGAEASYLVIQDVYDRGRFDEVEPLVYAFSDKAGGQSYWLAKSFVVLGDAFVENGNLRQARATFESIRDGYAPYGAEDDIPEAVRMRLTKLDALN